MGNKERNIISDLLIDINSVKMDLQGSNGDPAVAKANQVAAIIDLIGKHQNIFPNDIKLKVDRFVIAYKSAQNGFSVDNNSVFKLIDPTKKCIIDFLEKRHKELS